MSFVEFTNLTDKTDVAQEGTIGRKSFCFPGLLDNETFVLNPDCAMCSKLNSHNVVKAIGFKPDHNETRYNDVPEEKRVTVEDLNELQASLHALGYAAFGYIDDTAPYNVGDGGNNASQTVRYKVVSASGTSLTLQGRNPKKLILGNSRPNPLYPLPDPVTGETSRLIQEEFTAALPVGAMIEPLYPSVLCQKSRPMIVSIGDTTSDNPETTFTVVCSQNVANIDRPLDLLYPAEEYYVNVRFEALYPADWRNFQKPRESAFTRRTRQISTAAIHRLKDSNADNTRVLYAGWFTGSFIVNQTNLNASIVTWTDAQINSRLLTTQTGEGTWTVDFDCSDLDFSETIDFLTLTYHCEAVASDTYRIWHQASCSNAQVEPTGSALYVHHNLEHCTRIESSEFDTFKAGCWQPNCDGFSLGDQSNGFGNKVLPPKDLGDSAWLSSLWTRSDFYVEQRLQGIPSFKFSKPTYSGPSIYSLCGSFFTGEQATGTYIPQRYPWFGPKFGKRVTWSEDGNEYQGLVLGAFYAQAYDNESTGGTKYVYDATENPEQGSIPAAVSGWSAKENALGDSMDTNVGRLPYRWIGSNHIYDYTEKGNAMAIANELLLDADAFIVNADFTLAEDTNTTASVRALFA